MYDPYISHGILEFFGRIPKTLAHASLTCKTLVPNPLQIMFDPYISHGILGFFGRIPKTLAHASLTCKTLVHTYLALMHLHKPTKP